MSFPWCRRFAGWTKHSDYHSPIACVGRTGERMVKFTPRRSKPHAFVELQMPGGVTRNTTGLEHVCLFSTFFLIHKTTLTFLWRCSCQLHVCPCIRFHQPQVQKIEGKQCPQLLLGISEGWGKASLGSPCQSERPDEICRNILIWDTSPRASFLTGPPSRSGCRPVGFGKRKEVHKDLTSPPHLTSRCH